LQLGFKLVLCVREDLKMGRGKIASQCSHATLGMMTLLASVVIEFSALGLRLSYFRFFFCIPITSFADSVEIYKQMLRRPDCAESLKAWEKHGQKKVVLSLPNEATLYVFGSDEIVNN
jgi:peptidyl-tRNA hydrolase